MTVLQDSLRDLGAQHVGWGAKPEDYATVRDAIVLAIHGSDPLSRRSSINHLRNE